MRSPAALSATHARDGEAAAPTIAAVRRSLARSFRAQRASTHPNSMRVFLSVMRLASTRRRSRRRAQRMLEREARDAIEALARRRFAREPVARIVGSKEFWSLKLSLTEATLVPRPESETVVEAALAAIDAQGPRTRLRRIADLGTGSGALLLALMRELPGAFGVGTDTSPRALMVRARERAAARRGAGGVHRLRHGRRALRTVRPDRVQSAVHQIRRHRCARPRGARFRSARGARWRARRARLLSRDCRRSAGAARARRRSRRRTRRRAGAGRRPHCSRRRGLRRGRPAPIFMGCLARCLRQNGRETGHERQALLVGKPQQKSTWNIRRNRLACAHGIGPR